jgi:hypothetical protein
LEDISSDKGKETVGSGSLRSRIENELVIQVAEVVDSYYSVVDGWEKEFQPRSEDGEGMLLIIVDLNDADVHRS